MYIHVQCTYIYIYIYTQYIYIYRKKQLLVAPGIDTRNPGIATSTSSKDATGRFLFHYRLPAIWNPKSELLPLHSESKMVPFQQASVNRRDYHCSTIPLSPQLLLVEIISCYLNLCQFCSPAYRSIPQKPQERH